jgi:hypothetical protein
LYFFSGESSWPGKVDIDANQEKYGRYSGLAKANVILLMSINVLGAVRSEPVATAAQGTAVDLALQLQYKLPEHFRLAALRQPRCGLAFLIP